MKTLHSFLPRRVSTTLTLCVVLLLPFSTARGAEGPVPIEPGPESGGLRMRLVVASIPSDKESKPESRGFDVRLDLLNVTDHPIVLRAAWWHQTDEGDLKDYLEAATSIETYPPIAPWTGQVMAGRRVSPQPERTLKPGETLSLNWQTDKPQLKNRITNPLSVQNPQFPTPGLYSVHARIIIHADGKEVLLRSNEQLISIGGSREMPKHTMGHLHDADPEKKTATLSLGALQKIALGNQFSIRTGMLDHWKLTITHVYPEYSVGRLNPEPMPAESSRRTPQFPERRTEATLVQQK